MQPVCFFTGLHVQSPFQAGLSDPLSWPIRPKQTNYRTWPTGKENSYSNSAFWIISVFNPGFVLLTSHFPPCPNAASQHCQGYRWRARDLTQAPRDPSHIALGAVGINVTNQQITGSLDYPFWGWEFFTIQMYGKFLRDFPKKTMHWVGLVIYWPPSKRPSFEILRRGCSCRTRRLECRCWCGKRNLGRWLDGRDDYGSWW